MKKRLLSLIIVGALSIVMLYGCGDKEKTEDITPSQTQSENDTAKDNSNDDANTTDEDVEDKAEEKFTEAISTIYNTDYSSSDNVKVVNDYINANFTEETKEDMLNTVKDYSSKISSSDFVITLTKEVDNIDDTKYASTYEIRYNVTITNEKPFVYPDIIATVVIDKSGNVLINKINEGNF